MIFTVPMNIAVFLLEIAIYLTILFFAFRACFREYAKYKRLKVRLSMLNLDLDLELLKRQGNIGKEQHEFLNHLIEPLKNDPKKVTMPWCMKRVVENKDTLKDLPVPSKDEASDVIFRRWVASLLSLLMVNSILPSLLFLVRAFIFSTIRKKYKRRQDMIIDLFEALYKGNDRSQKNTLASGL